MRRIAAVFVVFAACAAQVAAQGRGGRGGGGGAAFPQHAPADPAAVARGRALYGIHCNFCHGSDARGGEGGPNLLRTDTILNDQKGELLAPVVQNGRGEMPKFALTPEQIADVAAFIHSFPVNNRDPTRNPPPTIVVGDAKAGEATFKTLCASCHSPTGDLKGIASKVPDPKALQNAWLMPGGGGGRGGRGGPSPIAVPPVTVTVTPTSGKPVTGKLVRIDDFIVTLTDADGVERTFRRDGATPKVEIHDPVQPHKDLLPRYSDKQIHDLTAYIVTL